MEDKSYVTNCRIVPRHDQEKFILEWPDGSNTAIVRMDRYLLVPIEMFTDRQVKTALKKWQTSVGLPND